MRDVRVRVGVEVRRDGCAVREVVVGVWRERRDDRFAVGSDDVAERR